MVRLILEKGFNPNDLCPDGGESIWAHYLMYQFSHSAQGSDENIYPTIRVLLRHGADIDAACEFDGEILRAAKVVRKLVSHDETKELEGSFPKLSPSPVVLKPRVSRRKRFVKAIFGHRHGK